MLITHGSSKRAEVQLGIIRRCVVNEWLFISMVANINMFSYSPKLTDILVKHEEYDES